MKSSDVLEMKLCDVSDLLLSEIEGDFIKFEIPGCNVKSKERFVLTVSLRKGDLK